MNISDEVTNNASAGLTQEDLDRMMAMAMGMGQQFAQNPGMYSGMDKGTGRCNIHAIDESKGGMEIGQCPKGARFTNAYDAEYDDTQIQRIFNKAAYAHGGGIMKNYEELLWFALKEAEKVRKC